MEKGRDPLPKKVRFTTWTLRYNNMAWVTVDALDQHWTRARVDAELVTPEIIQATTTNVSALTFSFNRYGVPALAGQPLCISKSYSTANSFSPSTFSRRLLYRPL